MDLKKLFAIIIYYGLISLFYLSIPVFVADGASASYDFSSDLNSSAEADEIGGIDPGDVFDSILRYFAFVGFGFGLPDGTPVFVSGFFVFWTVMINLLVIGWIVNIIWTGGG